MNFTFFRSAISGGTVDSAPAETGVMSANAAVKLSKNRIGALVAIERDIGLGEYVEHGVRIDAALTSELLESLFYPGSALHDGAVIVQHDRVAAAGCLLPLTDDTSLSKSMGTRHRAAIGISEETDAIGLRSVIFPKLQVERARSASLDGHWQHGALEVSGTVSWSRITHAVRLDSIPGDPAGRLRFSNATGPTDNWAGELFAVYHQVPIVFTFFYGYLHGSEQDPDGGKKPVRAGAFGELAGMGGD